MKYLFSLTGKRALKALTPQSLIAFDFDGTLAPIRKIPDSAYILARTNELLKQLSEVAPIAIISGRSLSDLKKRLRFTPAFLVGNHGLEGPFAKDDSLRQSKKTCRVWIKQIENQKNDPVVFLENKTFSLSLHYRNSRNKLTTQKLLLNQISHLRPKPQIVFGKNVLNIIPRGVRHKGTALLELMKNFDFQKAFYIGDDETDENVFTLPTSKILTARVGRSPTSEASFYLKNQRQVNELLMQLLGKLTS